MSKYTIQDLQDHLMACRDVDDPGVNMDRDFPLAKRIECADGFSMSVQASHGAYCSPRCNIATWTEVEVGFPSEKPDSFMHRAEDPERPTDTVYGYVPVELVVEEINRHGGVK